MPKKAKQPKAGGSTPATNELTRLGVAFTTRGYTHDPAAESYGLEAATALGVDPARVFKTLLATVGGGLVVGVIPVLTTLDLKALARSIGGRKATMAAPDDAERATGYVVGGISPFGQRRRHTTVVDESATAHTTILVSGGKRGFDIEIAPAGLIDVTGAHLATIGRGGQHAS